MYKLVINIKIGDTISAPLLSTRFVGTGNEATRMQGRLLFL